MRLKLYRLNLLVLIMISPAIAFAQTLNVTSTSPQANAWDVSGSSNIVITCSATLSASSATGIHVYSRDHGFIDGTATVSGNILTFDPQNDLPNGDQVTVSLSTDVKSTANDILSAAFSYVFFVNTTVPADPLLFKQKPIYQPDPLTFVTTMASVDIDNDGDQEIFLSNRWMENAGDGDFIPHNYTTQTGIETLQPADIDNDNDMDIIAGGGGGILVFRNNGTTELESEVIVATNFVTDLRIADKNGDGLLDILFIAQAEDPKLAWAVNNGDGTFTTQVVLAQNAFMTLAAGDVDGDRIADFISSDDYNHEFMLFKGTGSGYTSSLLGAGYFTFASMQDMNNDGDLDIIVNKNSNLVIMENSGSGNFTEHVIDAGDAVQTNNYDIADMDADGLPDIILGNWNSLDYLRNLGNLTFSRVLIQEFQNTQLTNALARDMDMDGDLDIVYKLHSEAIGWMRNSTPGEMYPFEQNSFTDLLPDQTSAVAWADYDKDGDQDLLGMVEIDNVPLTRLYRNTATGLELVGEFNGAFNGACEWLDLEKDGDLDFIVAGSVSEATKTFIYTNSSGNFTLLEQATLPGLWEPGITIADFDQDGKDDMILGGGTEGAIYTYEDNEFVKVFQFEYISQGATFTVSDIDLDGDPDFVAVGWTGNSGYGKVFINEGNFKFTRQDDVIRGMSGGQLHLRDFDNDGDADLAGIGLHFSDWGSYTSFSFYDNIDGALTYRPYDPGKTSLSADYGSAAADFNNDGYVDIFTRLGNEETGRRILRNDRSGWFKYDEAVFPGYNTDSYYRFATGIDFDGDTDIDLMIDKKIFRNNTDKINNAPAAPTTLSDSVRNNILYMYWSGATDTETQPVALTYQPYVGRSHLGTDIVSPQTNIQTGKQYIQREGPARKLWSIKATEGGDHYWSVQAIDAALKTSGFATEKVTKVIFIEGETRSCSDTEQVYKAFPAGDYTWDVEGGEVISDTGDEITITWTAEGYGTVSATDGINKNTLDVRIVTKPVPLIYGESSVCSSSSDNVYKVTNVANHLYYWIATGGTVLGDPGSSEVHVEWDGAGTGNIRVIETSSEAVCVIEQSLHVAINASPVPTISGPDYVCSDDRDGNLYTNTTPGAGTTMEWSIFGGDAGGDIDNDVVNVTWNEQAIGRVTLKESNEFCSATANLEVTIVSLVRPDITGTFVVCDPALNYHYTIAEQEGYTYAWTVNGGTKDNDNTPEIVVKWKDQAEGTILLTQSLHGCVVKDSVFVNIYPKYKPAITSVGDAQLTTQEAIEYHWTLNGDPLSQNTQTIYVQEPGEYRVTILDYHGCEVKSEIFDFGITGVGETESFPLALYPNPAARDLYIELENDYRGDLNIIVYDVLGKVMTSLKETKREQRFLAKVNNSGYSGTAVVEITGSDFMVRRKIIYR